MSEIVCPVHSSAITHICLSLQCTTNPLLCANCPAHPSHHPSTPLSTFLQPPPQPFIPRDFYLNPSKYVHLPFTQAFAGFNTSKLYFHQTGRANLKTVTDNMERGQRAFYNVLDKMEEQFRMRMLLAVHNDYVVDGSTRQGLIKSVKRFQNWSYQQQESHQFLQDSMERIGKMTTLFDGLNAFIIESSEYFAKELEKLATLPQLSFKPLQLPLDPEGGIGQWSDINKGPAILIKGKIAECPGYAATQAGVVIEGILSEFSEGVKKWAIQLIAYDHYFGPPRVSIGMSLMSNLRKNNFKPQHDPYMINSDGFYYTILTHQHGFQPQTFRLHNSDIVDFKYDIGQQLFQISKRSSGESVTFQVQQPQAGDYYLPIAIICNQKKVMIVPPL